MKNKNTSCQSKMNGALVIIFSILAILIPASSLSARPVKIWSLKELNEKADLVIAGTVESTVDAKGIEYSAADIWIWVDTVFNIDCTFKGGLKTDPVTVRHYRYHEKNAETATVDGPSFVEFNPKLKNQYLIFLKRTGDGSYEPLTGQYDPDHSFFLLQRFHKTKEREASLERKTP